MQQTATPGLAAPLIRADTGALAHLMKADPGGIQFASSNLKLSSKLTLVGFGAPPGA